MTLLVDLRIAQPKHIGSCTLLVHICSCRLLVQLLADKNQCCWQVLGVSGSDRRFETLLLKLDLDPGS